MKTKTIKIVSLFLIVIFLLGCTDNKENAVLVETENGKEVVLENFRFGLIKVLEEGRLTKQGEASGGEDFTMLNGGKLIIYPQNEIKFKPGATFGATWFVPKLDTTDQILLKIQFETPKVTKNGEIQRATSSVDFKISPKNGNADANFNLELESGDPLGEYKVMIFNKGRLLASNVFHIRK